MLKTNFWASVVAFLCFWPWNEQWKSTKSSWLTFSAVSYTHLMRDIQMVLERWGAWAANNHEDVTWSSIAAGFKAVSYTHLNARSPSAESTIPAIPRTVCSLVPGRSIRYCRTTKHQRAG